MSAPAPLLTETARVMLAQAIAARAAWLEFEISDLAAAARMSAAIGELAQIMGPPPAAPDDAEAARAAP